MTHGINIVSPLLTDSYFVNSHVISAPLLFLLLFMCWHHHNDFDYLPYIHQMPPFSFPVFSYILSSNQSIIRIFDRLPYSAELLCESPSSSWFDVCPSNCPHVDNYWHTTYPHHHVMEPKQIPRFDRRDPCTGWWWGRQTEPKIHTSGLPVSGSAHFHQTVHRRPHRVFHPNILHRTSSQICQFLLLDSLYLLPGGSWCRWWGLWYRGSGGQKSGQSGTRHFPFLVLFVSPQSFMPFTYIRSSNKISSHMIRSGIFPQLVAAVIVD